MTTETSDDLRRILAYDDAIDTRRSVTEIGPELYVVPFWTQSMCSAIIRAAEAV
ncbi:MAG: hypothetical protein RLZ86_886, partial [Actinomycetota bacterium]